MTIPFTYLIGWSHQDLWYYGVKYAKGCKPSDLWTTYFTSSKYVNECRGLYGEPDIIEIRRVFNTPKAAVLWEDAVIRRGKLFERSNFLNKAYTGGIHYDENVRKKMSDHAKQPRSDIYKTARSNTMKRLWKEGVFNNRPTKTKEHQEKITNSLLHRYQNIPHHSKGIKLSEEHKNNISKGVKANSLLLSPDEKAKKYGHPGQSNHMYGKEHSSCTKEKIRQKALSRPKFQCTGCGKEVTKSVMARYHKQCNR